MLQFLKKLSRKYPRLKYLRFMAQGLATYVPRVRFLPRHHTQFVSKRVRVPTDYNDVTRVCYSNWMRFLVSTNSQLQLSSRGVVEVGPGDYLGVGLAALLSGFDVYYPVDKVDRSRNYDNLRILEELIVLFQNRVSIPNNKEIPKAYPWLNVYNFPEFLSDDFLTHSLSRKRLDDIREVVRLIQRGASWAKVGNIAIEYPSGGESNKRCRFFVFDCHHAEC